MPKTIHLKDYTPPAYLIDQVELDLDIHPGATTVSATLKCRRNPLAASQALVLDGNELETLSIALDGKTLGASDYALTATQLTIPGVP